MVTWAHGPWSAGGAAERGPSPRPLFRHRGGFRRGFSPIRNGILSCGVEKSLLWVHNCSNYNEKSSFTGHAACDSVYAERAALANAGSQPRWEAGGTWAGIGRAPHLSGEKDASATEPGGSLGAAAAPRVREATGWSTAGSECSGG